MKKMNLLFAAVFMAAVLSGCSSGKTTTEQQATAEQTTEQAEGKVMVAAAASLEYAFSENLIPMFEEENPGITVEGTYDSSGKLQQQIEAGLQADLFFSAAEKQMNALIEEGMIEEDSKVNYLENKVVMIVPADSTSEIASFEDVVKAEHVAVGDPASVPVGQYTEEALKTLGLWDEISPKMSLGTNVTEVLNWVAEGSADCGFVYATDAATTDKVKVIAEAPQGSLKTPVVYPVAKLKAAPGGEAADKFFEFLTSDAAAEVFEDYGFSDYRK